MLIVSLSSMAFVFYVSLGLNAYTINRKNLLNKLFLAYSMSLALWSMSSVFLNAITNQKSLLYVFWDKLGALGWCSYYGIILHMAHLITRRTKFFKFRAQVLLIYTPGIIMFLINILFLYKNRPYFVPLSNYYTLIDFICSFSYVSATLIMIGSWGYKSKVEKERKQAKILVSSALISYVLGIMVLDIPPLFGHSGLFIANVVSMFLAAGIVYSIKNYDFLKISVEEATKYIFSKIQDMVILLDLDEKIIYSNAQVLINLGFKEEALLGLHYSFLIGSAIPIPAEQVDITCKDASGNLQELTMTSTSIYSKSNDKIGYLLVLKNVKDPSTLNDEENLKQQIEDTLNRNQTSFDMLIRYTKDAIIIHDKQEIIFVNESTVKYIGFINPEYLLADTPEKLIPLDLKGYIDTKLIDYDMTKKTPVSFWGKLLQYNGKIIDVSVTSTSFNYYGRQAVLTIIHDISPQIQVEELKEDVTENLRLLEETKQYNKVVTEFFSNVSHEFKTPINVISSSVQILKFYNEANNAKSEKCDNYLDTIRQNCYRLNKLINNLLDLSRIDNGFVKLSLSNVNFVMLVEEITQSIIPYAEKYNINLIFDTSEEEKIMSCDVSKIEHIVYNLLSNAIKFTNPGGSILVNLGFEDNIATITIKDTGIGIPQENLASIFDRFSQVDKTLRRNYEGSGIGLSLAKSLVEMHGGAISVKSKLGTGTTFTIKLPIITADNEVLEAYVVNSEMAAMELSDISKDNL